MGWRRWPQPSRGAGAQSRVMSWQDRDYNQYRLSRWQRAEWVGLLPPPATLLLLLLHFIASLALAPHLAALDPIAALLLHPLLTRGLFDGVLVMALLWWLGTRVELEIGPWRTVALYFFGALAAALFIEAAARWIPAASGLPTWPVGALAAWTIALWRSPSFDPVSIFGSVQPLRRVLLIGWGLLAVLMALRGRSAAPSWWLAAVGGGLAAMLESVLAEWIRTIQRQRRHARAARAARPRPADQAEDRQDSRGGFNEPDIDEILKKISCKGIGSLSQAERDQLEAARRAKLARTTSAQEVR